jgi:hypothetical protein
VCSRALKNNETTGPRAEHGTTLCRGTDAVRHAAGRRHGAGTNPVHVQVLPKGAGTSGRRIRHRQSGNGCRAGPFRLADRAQGCRVHRQGAEMDDRAAYPKIIAAITGGLGPTSARFLQHREDVMRAFSTYLFAEIPAWSTRRKHIPAWSTNKKTMTES